MQKRRWSDELRFRPGQMPPLFGDTAATLIVDDDQVFAQVLQSVLEEEGYHCTLAADAHSARTALDDHEFALALIDVMMPGESGLELATDILRDHPDLAVVMVTAVDDPAIAQLALDSGAYGYVVKPMQPNQVLITVANAGRRRCLEIEGRMYQDRLERRLDEQAADLDEALIKLKDKDGPEA